MSIRPSLRVGLTTVAASVILVAGAGLASYAATGQAFVLGHSNKAGGTTSLKNTGRGPALSLNSIKSAPPLVVNSKKMVKNLNANMVGGMTASNLNGYDLYKLGTAGGTISTTTPHFFTIKPPTGYVHYSLTGIWTSATTSDTLECLVVDKRFLTDMTNIAFIYAEFRHAASDPDGPFINQQGFAKFTKSQRLLIGCEGSGTGPIEIAQPITFAFHTVGAQIKHGTPFVPRNAMPGGGKLRSPLGH
jgi:hypothetical protein